MKKLHIAIGLVLLLALSASVSAATMAPAAKQTVLVLDGNPTVSTPGYEEGNIYAQGWTGTEPSIGRFHDAYVPAVVGEFMSHAVWRIDGSGDIWIVYFLDNAQTPTAQGVIIGGTGKYQGASGQVSQEVVSEDPFFIVQATFVFDKAIKP